MGKRSFASSGKDAEIGHYRKPADIDELRTIALLCCGFAENDLRDAGACAIFRDPADLLDRYYRSPLAG
ncbi:MAG: hypothetical protein ABJB09_05135 [Verrucomicrobiota bacterium]